MYPHYNNNKKKNKGFSTCMYIFIYVFIYLLIYLYIHFFQNRHYTSISLALKGDIDQETRVSNTTQKIQGLIEAIQKVIASAFKRKVCPRHN
jgi:hypothetical protein